MKPVMRSPSTFSLRQPLALVAIFSSLDSAIGQSAVQQIPVPNGESGLGETMARFADLDSDGAVDILSANQYVSGPNGAASGEVVVFSTRSGTRLLQVVSPIYWEHLGSAIAGGMDADGDGVPDIVAAGSYGAGLNTPLEGAGSVHLISGATGVDILQVIGPNFYAGLGRSVAQIGDVDLDGFPDFVAGAVGDTTLGQVHYSPAGSVRIYSSKTGSLLTLIGGPSFAGHLGFAVADAGDPNQDGVADVLFNDGILSGIAPDVIHVASGSNGSLLATMPGWDYLHTFRPDIDQDGFGDYIAQEPSPSYRVVVYSGHHFQPLLYLPYSVTNVLSTFDGSPDLNADGRDDIVVATGQHYFPGQQPPSASFAVSGLDGSMIAKVPGGQDAVGLSDINGDGRAEFASAPFAAGSTILNIYSPTCGAKEDYGSACVTGSGVTPKVVLDNSCFTPGGKVVVALLSSLGTSLLAVSATQAAVPLGGGCSLLVGSPMILLPVPMPFGFSSFQTTIPIDASLGNVYLQLLTPDPTKPKGIASSRGTKLTID